MYKQFQQNNTNKTKKIIGNDKNYQIYLHIYKIHYYNYNILLSI